MFQAFIPVPRGGRYRDRDDRARINSGSTHLTIYLRYHFLLSDTLSVYLRYHFLLPGKLGLHILVGVAEHLVGTVYPLVGIVYPLVKAAFHGYHLIQNYLIAFSYRFGYDSLYGPGKQFDTAI